MRVSPQQRPFKPVSLLPSQYKALPSSGDFCSATCNPLPLNCSYNLCHPKLANNTACSSFFVCWRGINTGYRVPATNTGIPNAPCAILTSHIAFAIVSLTHSGLNLQLPTHAFAVHFISDSPPSFSCFPKPYLAKSILPANPPVFSKSYLGPPHLPHTHTDSFTRNFSRPSNSFFSTKPGVNKPSYKPSTIAEESTDINTRASPLPQQII